MVRSSVEHYHNLSITSYLEHPVNEMIKHYRGRMMKFYPFAFFFGVMAIILLAARYYLFPGFYPYLYGTFGWACATLCGGLLLSSGAYALLIYHHEWKIWKLMAQDVCWFHRWFTRSLVLVVGLILMLLANAFVGFLPLVPPDNSVPALALANGVGSLAMGFYSLLRAVFFGRFHWFVLTSILPAPD